MCWNCGTDGSSRPRYESRELEPIRLVSIEASLVGYYSERAKEFERVYEKPERQEELRALKEFVRIALAGRHVVEVACGTGYWTEIVSASAASITAFDASEAVLEIARTKRIDPAKVRFLVGDAYRLPAFPRLFDGALVAFFWSHIPKARLGRFLRGLRAALAPGAVAVFLDNTYVEGNSTPLARRDDDGNTYQLRRLENGRTFEVLKNYPAGRELHDAMREFGEDVELEWIEHYWRLKCAVKKRPASRGEQEFRRGAGR